jgi:hypothetical protein
MQLRRFAPLAQRLRFRLEPGVSVERQWSCSVSSEATAAGDGYFEYGVLDRA